MSELDYDKHVTSVEEVLDLIGFGAAVTGDGVEITVMTVRQVKSNCSSLRFLI